MPATPAKLNIGDFSRATLLTIKTLRHYHDTGLLEAAEVDAHTGYRRYLTSQIPQAQMIKRFRELRMPLNEIRQLLASPEGSTLVTQSRRAVAPAGGLISDEIITKGRGVATVYIPCDGPIESIGRVRPYRSPEVELATIVHTGSHRSFDIAYGALATHVARYELAADGPLREQYLVGPLDTSDESAWRTEIGWPIVMVAERP